MKKKDQEMEANQIQEVEGEEDTDHALSLSKEEDLGETIEPFNLKDDMDNGFFDPNGNYVWRRKDRDEGVKDAWMESMEDGDGEGHGEEDMKKTAAAHAVQQAMGGGTGGEDDDEEEDAFDEQALLKLVVSILDPEESVAAALKRLGGSKASKVKKHWHKGKKAGDATAPAAAAPAAKAAHKNFVPLTDASNAMLNNSCTCTSPVTLSLSLFLSLFFFLSLFLSPSLFLPPPALLPSPFSSPASLSRLGRSVSTGIRPFLPSVLTSFRPSFLLSVLPSVLSSSSAPFSLSLSLPPPQKKYDDRHLPSFLESLPSFLP
jgi:hypothetical protein